ncbi:MAG: cobyrinate a,c-diamide synthase [Rhodospirillaceae bacterium]|nr:cobyrinate a,c-diamide synthase [Rhodospirillaceae bacterium]
MATPQKNNGQKGIIIAATSSGSGKTVLSLGLLAHLKREGIKAAPLKVGPDYIDPSFHAHAVGRKNDSSFNIDPWAMRPETISHAANSAGDNADIIICEGVMGLFDGATHASGSTADIAELTGWPIILVVDVSRQGASAAAVVKGFNTFRKNTKLAGVIFNKVGSERHEAMLRAAMKDTMADVPILGMVPNESGLELPSRHLGLIQAMEHTQLDAFMVRAARAIGYHVDIKAILDIATTWDSAGFKEENASPLRPLGQKIAIARDEAFSFSYPLTIEGWRKQGAEIEFFSPLEDMAPPKDADAIYLPGGYPELHVWRLASADRFMAGLRDAAKRKTTIYGECGGYMVLGRGMIDADGTTHAMAGLLQLGTSFEKRKLSLGYRRVTLCADNTPLGIVRRALRGHEFHYATITSEGPGEALFEAEGADGTKIGKMGLVSGNVFGSFVHLIDREAK